MNELLKRVLHHIQGGLKRSLVACNTYRNWNCVLTRIGGDYVAN